MCFSDYILKKAPRKYHKGHQKYYKSTLKVHEKYLESTRKVPRKYTDNGLVFLKYTGRCLIFSYLNI